MKATGIARRVDILGRVVIPKELRRTLGIESNDPLEMYVEGDLIFLTKYKPACIFCDSTEEVKNYRDKLICTECLAALKEMKQYEISELKI